LCYRDPYQIARSFYQLDSESITEWWQTHDADEAVEQANEILQVLENSLRPMTDDKLGRIYKARYEELNNNFKAQWHEVLDFLDVEEGRVVKWARNSFDYREYDDLEDTIFEANDEVLDVLSSKRSFFGYG
jgi:arginine deiminase